MEWIQMKAAGNRRCQSCKKPLQKYSGMKSIHFQGRLQNGSADLTSFAMRDVPDRGIPCGQEIIQRVVFFEDPQYQGQDPSEIRIGAAYFPRPRVKAPEGLSGFHTTAIVAFQRAAESAVIGHTYHEALENLRELARELEYFPGAQGNPELEGYYRNYMRLLDFFHELDPMNWGAYLDKAAREFIILRNHLYWTYHEPGRGDKKGGGESGSIGALEYQLGLWRYNPRELAEAIIGLIDLNKCRVAIEDERSLRYMMEVWHQHILSLMQIHPQLNEDRYRRAINWAYTIFSRQVGGVNDLQELLPERRFPYPLVTYYQ